MLLYKCVRLVDLNFGIIFVCFLGKVICNFIFLRFKKFCLDYFIENYFVCFYFVVCFIMF